MARRSCTIVVVALALTPLFGRTRWLGLTHLKVANVSVNLLLQRLVTAQDRRREPRAARPTLQDEAEVDEVAVGVVEVLQQGVAQGDVVGAALDARAGRVGRMAVLAADGVGAEGPVIDAVLPAAKSVR